MDIGKLGIASAQKWINDDIYALYLPLKEQKSILVWFVNRHDYMMAKAKKRVNFTENKYSKIEFLPIIAPLGAS